MICDFEKCKCLAKVNNYCKQHHYTLMDDKTIFHSKKNKNHKFIWTNAKGQLSCSVQNRNELADYDYIDKLTNKEIYDFLKAFNREYVNADFQHPYKKLHKKKKQRIDIYNKNNSRNRDVFTKAKTANDLIYAFNTVTSNSNRSDTRDMNSYEKMLITIIDNKEFESLTEYKEYIKT